MTGTTWVQESGLLEGPVAITNTHSVGVVRDAIIQWEVSPQERPAAVVAARGRRDLRRCAERHQRLSREAGARACRTRSARPAACRRKARSAAAPEWCATGSRAASAPRRGSCPTRRAATPSACSCSATTASRRDLRIAGVPVGEEIPDLPGCIANNDPLPPNAARPRCDAAAAPRRGRRCGAGIDHRRRGDRRAAAAAPTETDGHARVAWDRTARRLRRQQLGRHLRRVFHRQRRAPGSTISP